jgi:2-amino-4-hydroxy-6-hydroxymethyldihydropteridine diphosphokinase
LGSNLGDRAENLRAAVRALAALAQTSVVAQSAIHETAAVVPPENPAPQPAYLNAVVELDTGLSAVALHGHLKAIETQLGRTSSTRWAPRVIDLDLLLMGEERIHSEHLIVPHERMQERRFVLEPMVELAPELVHPSLNRTMRQLLSALTG